MESLQYKAQAIGSRNQTASTVFIVLGHLTLKWLLPTSPFIVLPFQIHLFGRKSGPSCLLMSLLLLGIYHDYWTSSLNDTSFCSRSLLYLLYCVSRCLWNTHQHTILFHKHLLVGIRLSLNLILGFVTHVGVEHIIHCGYLQYHREFLCSSYR